MLSVPLLLANVAAIHAGWIGLGVELQAAWLQAGATALAAAIGVGAIIGQIRSQNDLSRKAILAAEARKVRTDTFAASLAITDNLNEACITFSVSLSGLLSRLRWYVECCRTRTPAEWPCTDYLALKGLQDQFIKAGAALANFAEIREVVDPRVIVFRDAICAILHDLNLQMTGSDSFRPVLLLAQDFSAPDAGMRRKPSVEEAEIVQGWVGSLLSIVHDAMCTSTDFQIEMQNLLLSDLFQTPTNPRTPVDRELGVITLANSSAIRAWIRENTAWGKLCAETDRRTSAALEAGQQAAPSTLRGLGPALEKKAIGE